MIGKLIVFVTSLFLLFSAGNLGAELYPVNTVVLDQAIHFLGPEGEDVVAQAGTYRVDLAADEHLWLIPSDDNPTLLIQAQQTAHEKELESSFVLVHQENSDTVHLVVLLPERKALDAVGTLSGIRGRSGGLAVLGGSQITGALNARLSTPQPKVTLAGTPSAPTLQSPAPNHVLQGVSVQFTWVAGPTIPAQTTYELCITERDKSCTEPGAEKYSALPSATLSFTPPNGLPLRFQGKELAWTVMACAPNLAFKPISGSTSTLCQSANRRPLAWTLYGPELGPPSGNVSLTPNFHWHSVTGAETYLLCIAKQGVPCPSEPMNTPNTLALYRPQRYYTPPDNQTLLRFAGQTVHWTAAACNVAFGCIYQTRVKTITLPTPIQAPPITAAPVLLSPENGAKLLGRRHIFSWDPVSAAFSYTLCVKPVGGTCGTSGSLVLAGLRSTASEVHEFPSWLWDGTGQRHLEWTVAACNAAGQCLYRQPERTFAVAEGIEEEFKVLAYNVYMRPWPFSVGNSSRAGHLPAHLKGYDAIIFSELFDNSIRANILAAIRTEYPHQTRVLGDDADFGIGQDGGVVIVSRWPIAPASNSERQRLFGSVCAGVLDDCLSEKGVLYAKVSKNGHIYHLFGTHTQAGHSPTRREYRTRQFQIIKNFIDSKSIPACQAVIVGGDFNVKRYAASFLTRLLFDGALHPELSSTLSTLNALEPAGLAHYRFGNATYFCTSCYGLNPIVEDADEGGQHLDYVTFSKAHRQPLSGNLRVLRPLTQVNWGTRITPPPTANPNKPYIVEGTSRVSAPYTAMGVNDLSDHFPVVGEFKFIWPVGPGC